MESDKTKSKPRFVKICGMELVYDPGSNAEDPVKKNPCPDCHFCQFCSDSRCDACRRGDRPCAGPRAGCRKLSLREQILLYDEINALEKKKADDNNTDSNEG